MKFYFDGIMFYFFRAIWRAIDYFESAFFRWFSEKFGSYPDADDRWFNE